MLILLSVVRDSCWCGGQMVILTFYVLISSSFSPGWQWWGMWMLGRALCWGFWLTVNWTMVGASLARSSSDTNMKWRAAGPAALEMTSWVLTRRDRWATVAQKFEESCRILTSITMWLDNANRWIFPSTAALPVICLTSLPADELCPVWHTLLQLNGCYRNNRSYVCIFHHCLYGCKYHRSLIEWEHWLHWSWTIDNNKEGGPFSLSFCSNGLNNILHSWRFEPEKKHLGSGATIPSSSPPQGGNQGVLCFTQYTVSGLKRELPPSPGLRNGPLTKLR